MRYVGYFTELPHGDSSGRSLRDARGELPQHLVAPAVRYLTGGAPLAAAACYAYDELDPARPEIAPLAILTDGDWSWPSDLPYYVQRYRVGLPADFLHHAQALGWNPPRLGIEQLERLSEQW
ncbi:hypothetical protein AB0B85_30770 [Micromonospora sp. NPDC049044]|uniref:hypothetical protein n=1 Tax=unclassified Micromonospora TaxID=2617518 RepID=UPI0033ECAE9A